MEVQTAQLIEINGARLDVRERGAGEPVVFVHGSMGDECAAIVLEPALIGHYRVIDYHRRGYGSSELPVAPVSIEQQAADVQAILRHLDIERAHLVGQSYGGVIILQTALGYPDAVQSLALLEPALPSVMSQSPEFTAVNEKAGNLYTSGDKAGAMETFGLTVGGDNFRVDFDRTLPPGYFERWVSASDTIFQSDFAALPAWQFTEKEAARISHPILNVVGENSRAPFHEIFKTLRAWFPQAENHLVPGSTHCILQVQPRAIAERLAAFFADHPI